MIEYSITKDNIFRSTTTGKDLIVFPSHCHYLSATHREREIIESNAPFLKDCHGTYLNAEANAAALAFNFTEK